MYCTVLWNGLKFNKNQVRVTEYHQWTDQILTVDMDSTRSNGQHLFMSVDDDNDGEWWYRVSQKKYRVSQKIQGVPKKIQGVPKKIQGVPKKGTNRMLLEPRRRCSITSSRHPCLEFVFLVVFNFYLAGSSTSKSFPWATADNFGQDFFVC